MFGIAGGVLQAITIIERDIVEREAFEKMCESLPASSAEFLRLARKDREKEEIEHIRKLEIAREGRSLNFWGDR